MKLSLKASISIGIVWLASFGAVAALHSQDYQESPNWWSPSSEQAFPALADYENDNGKVRVRYDGGPLDTKDHPFFTAQSGNGRACVTCHQPADAMSISAKTAKERWDATNGTDPLFAAIDGSNCPNLPQSDPKNHSALIEHGLIRVERPWPSKPWQGKARTPDFRIEVVRDPYGCNTGEYGPNSPRKSISVYRRPRPVANLKYAMAYGFLFDPKNNTVLPRDPQTREWISGNIMSDARAGTLREQMIDAGQSHLEMVRNFTPQQLAQIEDFEKRVYVAQQSDRNGGALNADGAKGGVDELANGPPGRLGSQGVLTFSDFQAWDNMSAETKAKLTPEQIAYRESVARGAHVFREKMFLIWDSAGINSPMGFGNPVRNSCVFCHNMSQTGMDVAPGQVDIGTTIYNYADPTPYLPLFRITCLGRPHPHYGRTFLTTDPGFALTSGKCADVGRITIQNMRGLSGRAPYFVNGMAKDIRGIVDYYDRRYNIGYTEQEKRDLTNLMGAL